MFELKSLLHTRWKKTGAGIILVLVTGWLILFLVVPRPLFSDPYSTLLYASGGELMGARIAPDGQWRFPATDSVPYKYKTCLLTFEDKRFYYHPGIDPAALTRALSRNIQSGKVTSGGSTITMQLVRLARGNPRRTLKEKLIEAGWTLYIESTHRKETILRMYAAHAPYGGNVVGMETASWRYFGRSAADLSWAESATLAVLPNAPALIHPGRNRERLRQKRDRLLWALKERGYLDQTDYELACMETLPEAPLPLPDKAPHLLTRMALQTPGTRMQSSLNASLQERVQDFVNRYAQDYSSNHIYNLSALVADVETGEVLAYAGNVSFKGDDRRGNSVDVIMAPRSTGSILKPFLYAGMLDDGLVLPTTLVSDVPLNINGFMPQNFNKVFYGAVPANRAIERSLNVPLVRMLSQYHTGRFMVLLKKLGMTTLRFHEDHYGAALILGGAEGTVWDLAGMYASLSRTLLHYRPYNGRYDVTDIRPLTLSPSRPPQREGEKILVTDERLSDNPVLSAASIWFTYEAMAGLNRPEEEAEWQQFRSMKKIAWKTGTSYGGRDAWAIGTTPRYVVAVWAGNASGEGRAGLTGVGNAAPVLFDIFSLLPGNEWFDMPYDEMEQVAVCRHSGHRASSICEPVDSLYIPVAGMQTAICPYHRLVHLSKDERFRVNSSCEPVDEIVTRAWFVLPPSQAYYYRNYHVDYLSLPPIRPGCEQEQSRQVDIIYPEHNAVLFLPKGFSGEKEKFIFKAAHTREEATLYWHLNDQYLGETQGIHEITCSPTTGNHLLTLIDDQGNQRRIFFEVK